MKCWPKERQTFSFWRVKWGDGVPAWVARKCHSTGGHRLTVNGYDGVSVANEGDVILSVNPKENEVAFVSKECFELNFEVVEE